ncbi:uncharacterized protein AKAME5_002622600 [Lates japonicus]|uniref:Uncharacterized protein n=1 Tax=Lates japonicus TaxID=270547 RepID=A0AAD3RMP0_LATJO|nr:uncharacterized protein AKAME5_002541300 [Lates japonicus]GLD74894.1 uncharacterized protein AKAME5_002622600 [Lates japonicus]
MIFIGVVPNSITMRVCLATEHVDNILHFLPCFQIGRSLPYMQFLCLVSKLTVASTVVPLGVLSLRHLQRWLNSLHLDAKWHRHRRVRVSQQCLLTLILWRRRSYMTKGIPKGSVISGSPSQWMLALRDGVQSAQDRLRHINVLELQAVHMALRQYLRGKHVLVRLDTTSTVYHITHQGGTRSA